jgi:hypothetical protein
MIIKSRHFIKTDKTKGLILIEIEKISRNDMENIIISIMKKIELK